MIKSGENIMLGESPCKYLQKVRQYTIIIAMRAHTLPITSKSEGTLIFQSKNRDCTIRARVLLHMKSFMYLKI